MNVSVLLQPGNREVKIFPAPLKTLPPFLYPQHIMMRHAICPMRVTTDDKLVVASVNSYAARNLILD
jgi:hypothetical protein